MASWAEEEWQHADAMVASSEQATQAETGRGSCRVQAGGAGKEKSWVVADEKWGGGLGGGCRSSSKMS